jgi:outer membrane receptor protein involved in Fe transport
MRSKQRLIVTMKKILALFFLIPFSLFLTAQNAFIKGTCIDAKTQEKLIGVTITVDDTSGMVTDVNGNYFFKASVGNHQLVYKLVGYPPLVKSIGLQDKDTLTETILLERDPKQLNIVVISAGRFEQKLTDVTVSMEVLKPSLIENKGIQTMEQAMDQVPGVNVIDGQANIRGGSGFSYGAGSRVLLMVDEMPMLTADAGDVKWNFLPIENCEQVEVIKGASSALFGSSAMNGVIHFRTAYAKEEPETKINFTTGIYDKPRRKELVWWKDGNPTYTGMNFYHAQKIKNLDLVIGGNLYNDEGYRYLETEQRYRTNVNVRYNFQKIKGLQIGVNINTAGIKGGLFLIWENPDSAYYPVGGSLSHYSNQRTNIDPFINYLTKNNGRHTLRSRFFRSNNVNNANQSSVADVYYTEYQYQQHFKNELTWTLGAVYNYNEVHANDLYGTHFSANASAYTQLDKKWKRLTASMGIRAEYFKTDSIETHETIYALMDVSKPIARQSKIKPVIRFGLNYQVLATTYLRTSFGQGFRFPSIAERYIRTSASGLEIYPNDSLTAESGWSAEIGIKQLLKIGEWKGYIDVAGFWTEYRNMMEFTFGQHGDPLKDPLFGLGFKSQNIGNTRIRGIEASMAGQGKIGQMSIIALIGYVYIDPRQTDFDILLDSAKNTTKTNLLKYRYEHSGKADIEFGYKKVSTGVSMRATSFMANIDSFFENFYFFPGMSKYRMTHKKGDAVIDYRISYQLIKTAKLSFIVNNIANREVMGRPADMQPPRVFAVQLGLKF